MSGDVFICVNCGYRGELNLHGSCGVCGSEAVCPDRFSIPTSTVSASASQSFFTLKNAD